MFWVCKRMGVPVTTEITSWKGKCIRFHCDNLPWTNQSSKHPGIMELLRTLFFTAAQHSLPDTPSTQTELYCGCPITQPDFTFRFPCSPGQPAANTSVSQAGRALEGHQSHLLHRAMAPSTSTTYRAGIWKYYTFCHTLGITPLPGSKHSINLFAAYLSQKLQVNTIQVYLAAVSHLHLTHGFSRPAHNKLTLNLAIRGIQRSQGPAHLRPKRLPLTIGMLEQLLGLLEADPLSRHDRLSGPDLWLLWIPEGQ